MKNTNYHFIEFAIRSWSFFSSCTKRSKNPVMPISWKDNWSMAVEDSCNFGCFTLLLCGIDRKHIEVVECSIDRYDRLEERPYI